MSAGSISLESSIRTCKVDTGWANKIESDRFLNSDLMVCPIWNGVDTAGRRVCPDSFVTKTAGCNSAEDRVIVENNQRPQYMEYINLSANGIDASIYGDDGNPQKEYGDSLPWNQVGQSTSYFNYPKNLQECRANFNKIDPKTGQPTYECYDNFRNITGSFGRQMRANVYPHCGIRTCPGGPTNPPQPPCKNENVYDLGQYQVYDTDKREMAMNSQMLRKQQALQEGYYGNNYRQASGF